MKKQLKPWQVSRPSGKEKEALEELGLDFHSDLLLTQIGYFIRDTWGFIKYMAGEKK